MPGRQPELSAAAEAGFTLLEVLAALAILAATLMAVLAAMTNGIGMMASVGGHAGALQVARSILETTAADPAALTSGAGGNSGGYTWQLSPRVVLDVVPPGGQGKSSRLYELTVDVSWPPARQIRMVTRRLVTVP